MSTPSSVVSPLVKIATVSILIILGRNSIWLVDSVRLVPTISDCVLSPSSAWQAPVVQAGFADLLTSVPYFFYAFFSALVIAGLVRLITKETNLTALLAVSSLSLFVQPLDLLPMICLLLLGLLSVSSGDAQRSALRLTMILLVALGALLITLEFGLVLLLLVLTLLEFTDQRGQRIRQIIAISIIAVITVSAGLSTGFFNACLRPASWVWLNIPTELLPSLQSPLQQKQFWPSLGVLAAFVFSFWFAHPPGPQSEKRIFLSLLLMSLIGIGSSHYLCLALCGLIILLRRISLDPLRQFNHPRLAMLAIFIAAGFAFWQTDKVAVLAGESPPRLVDPTRWQSEGNVILMNLEHSSDWQTQIDSRQYKLVLDDRWDIFGNDYHDYVDVCRDLHDIRVNSYLKDDLTWGGYKRRVDEWEASLLVVESSQWTTIRGLSVSPEWKVMSIDGRRTIFGMQGVPSNLEQLTQANRAIMFLEWPNKIRNFNLDETIVVGSNHDAQTIANALCAMRLPYAGMRFIRNDFSRQGEKIRTSCYLELAHRVHRHSGRGSLLDQFRAVARLREEHAKGIWEKSELSQVAISLQGLGLNQLAIDFGLEPDEQDQWISKSRDDSSEHEGLTSSEGEQAHVNAQFQQALLSGDVQACEALLEDSDESMHLGRLLTQSWNAKPLDLLGGMSQILKEKELGQASVQSEAYFYVGCLALELGEFEQAIGAFNRSQQLAPDLPFKSIRDLYLSQIVQKQ